jgi:hypothetical protein
MRMLRICLVVAWALLLHASVAFAQQPPECQPWIGIKSWQVSVTIVGSGSNSDPTSGSNSLQESDTVQVQFTVPPGDTPCTGNYGWIGVLQSYKANVHVNSSSTDVLGCRDDVSYSHNDVTSDSSVGFLSMDFEKGTYIASVGNNVAATPYDTESYSGNCEFTPTHLLVQFGPALLTCVNPLMALISGGIPASGALSGSASYTCSAEAGVGRLSPINSYSWTITWNMTPTPLNQDLLITIPQYNTWRPTAGRAEKDVGGNLTTNAPNTLGIRAQLIDKDTGLPSYQVPDTVTFTLSEVSHEPGVAMNWPPQGTATSDPDLTFDCAFNFAPGDIVNVDSKECDTEFTLTGTQIEFQPEDNSQPVLATLSPHDWGAWATLNVTAVVAGVAYQGTLASDPGNTNILIPQRQPGSFIADSWKNGKVPLSTPDSDDSENDPVGDGQKGDGFTLYEEYRGFYMGCAASGEPQPEGTAGAGCQHAEGDPATKDFFIVDTIGVDEQISDFQFASGLNVHFYGLNLPEVGPQGPGYRVINFNHAAAPHEVDQHAVVLQDAPSGSIAGFVVSQTVPTAGFPDLGGLLPKHVDHIQIGNTNAVAHELSHSVDVYHHGDIDHAEFWSLDLGTLTVTTASGPISILLETADPNSPTPADRVDLVRLKLDQVMENNPIDPATGKTKAGRWVYVGNAVCGGSVMLHGQHSGDQLDIMRYHVAQAYVPDGFPNVRIWTGSSEALGVDLTDHPGGTGVNDPSRKPRPRYGDAFAGTQGTDGRGNDRSQIDVNDNNQEVVRGTQTCH